MRNLSEPIFKTSAVGSKRSRGQNVQSCSRAIRTFKVAVIWALLAGAATYLFLVDPARSGAYPPCLFRLLTGLQCPGCGSIRALHQLMHGHPVIAFELNPLLLVALPFLVFAFLRFNPSFVRYYSAKIESNSPVRLGWLMVALVICFWIFRNTPFYPFVS